MKNKQPIGRYIPFIVVLLISSTAARVDYSKETGVVVELEKHPLPIEEILR